ncbi:GNAT family N-acetyltransferase [bacterium AH-315-P15]|nr:GNAT family N-acetyltransferase [bacterium AH-315-P15]
MLDVITPSTQEDHQSELREMFELRYRALIKHERWEALSSADNREVDEFDTERAYYLLSRIKAEGPIVGCVRFVSSEGPTLSSETFSHLFETAGLPTGRDIFDVSRFVVDPAIRSKETISPITSELYCGWMEFGMALGLKALTAVVDLRHMQGVIARGVKVEPLGLPIESGKMRILGVLIPTDQENLDAMRAYRGLQKPVLSQSQKLELQNARHLDQGRRGLRREAG